MQNIHFKTKDMRIKINDKIYRLKEIESGVDSLMELVEEPKYKEGDFVYEDGRIMIVKSYPNIHHAKSWPIFSDVLSYNGVYAVDFSEPTFRYATAEEKQELIELLRKDGKQWNADKKCIEDISKRKFKKGDKVRIKHGVSSKTHCNVDPSFVEEMDDLIGKTMTVDSYIDWDNYVVCNESGWSFLEEWLEPYVEELKEGDLAIFWDNIKKKAIIRVYKQFRMGAYFPHQDHMESEWKNAIKFESKEQFEKLINGEL